MCGKMDQNIVTVWVWLVSECSQNEGASEYPKKNRGWIGGILRKMG
jgi:hypothetical protein